MALLVGGVVVVLLAAGLGLGVGLGRGGKGGNGGGTAAAAGVAGSGATTGGSGQDAGGTGAAGSGAGGQAGSGGGGTGGGRGGSSSPTTTSATSTTTGATTTTEAPLAFADRPRGGAQASCTPSKSGGYDFTVGFTVLARFSGGGTFHSQWGRGRADVPVDPVNADTHDDGDGRYFQWQDRISGHSPSRTDTVVDHLHILDPPSVATTVTVTHSVC